MPQISVIVPVYKVESYLHRCVDSILAQTFEGFELILVDDGSPDSCGKICDEYAKKDDRVHVIHKQNGGLSDARNAGIDWAFEHSSSEWLAFIDSDDWVHPQYLELLLFAAQKHDASISVCYMEKVREFMPLKRLDSVNTDKIGVDDYYGTVEPGLNHFTAWGKLYKKNAFINTRFPFGRLHEDLYVTPTLLIDAGSIAMVRVPLYSYFLSNNSIMRGAWSEKRCNDELEASEAFVKLAKEKDLPQTYKFIVRRHAQTIMEHIKSIDKSGNPEYSSKRKQLVAELKSFWHENRGMLRCSELTKRYILYTSRPLTKFVFKCFFKVISKTKAVFRRIMHR